MTPNLKPGSKTFKIFVGNLTYRVTPAEVRELFEAFGAVVEVVVLKSFGFVHMVEPEEAKAAIEALNSHVLDGRVRGEFYIFFFFLFINQHISVTIMFLG